MPAADEAGELRHLLDPLEVAHAAVEHHPCGSSEGSDQQRREKRAGAGAWGAVLASQQRDQVSSEGRSEGKREETVPLPLLA